MILTDKRVFIGSGRDVFQVRYPWLGWDNPPYAHRSFYCGAGEPSGNPSRPREIVTHGDCGRKCYYVVDFPLGDYTQDNIGRPMNDPGKFIERYADGFTTNGNPKMFHRLWSTSLSSCEVTTDAVIKGPYDRGAWQYGGETYKLYALERCHRVFIYKNIYHDGSAYDDATLRNNPTYKLRRKAGTEPDADIRFEPWAWGLSDLTYERYYAKNGDDSDVVAPPGVTFPTSYPITDQADIETNLSGEAVLCGLKTGWSDFESVVAAGESHHLILELTVYYWKLSRQIIGEQYHGSPTPYLYVVGSEILEGGFYNIHGRAIVVV